MQASVAPVRPASATRANIRRVRITAGNDRDLVVRRDSRCLAELPALPRIGEASHLQPLRRAAADIARAAGGPLRSLAEVIADFFVAAIVRLHERANGVIALPGAVAFGGVGDLVGEKS